MADISLTASMRSNLLSLQNTQSMMDRTQDRLSTGKKVNSAIDNPSSYYTAQGLTNRASDLEALLDSMGQGIQTLKAATEGIESITSFVQQAKAIANTARDTTVKESLMSSTDFNALTADETKNITIKIGDQSTTLELDDSNADTIDNLVAALNGALANIANPEGGNWDDQLEFAKGTTPNNNKVVLKIKDGQLENFTSANISVTGWPEVNMSGKINPHDRENAIAQYNEILSQIDQIANDATYKGVNLLKEDDLKVVFNEDRSSYLEVKGDNATAFGLGLSAIEDWSTTTLIDETITDVENAISELRDMASTFGNNYSIVQTRQDFTENLINVLEEGSDNLVLADMNEESANMLALQTRQQLGINSLSLASQAAQGVLSLF